ncbi:Uncharacterized protein Fot_33572 [Forsythia ovata]|uniref:Uncharacterized protein n=1 Tax=Forsythia ovata TaxID=205694 RepID=A0ABD1TB14_9LAMI
MTRSAGNKESPDLVKMTALQSKQKVILLDTPTPMKETIFEKSRNPTDDSTHRRMRSCASKEMSKNQNIKKHWTDKDAQSSSPKKINQPQPYEAQLDERNYSNEKLNKIMNDIRLRQDQIIAQQVDLKYEVRAIRRSVDDKIAVFLEELKVKLDGKCSSNVPPGQIVVYKSVNTVFGAGICDQQNTSDPLDDKFYTEDVMEQADRVTGA